MKRTVSALLFVVLYISVSVAGGMLSPYTQNILKQQSRQEIQRSSFSGNTSKTELIPCYVTVNDESTISRLEEAGVGVNSVVGDIITAMIPQDMIETVASIDGVVRVDAGSIVSLTLDKGRADTGVDKVLEGVELTSGYDGTGIVVGVIDIGLQLDHINFYDASKNLRIKRIWLQDDTSGAPPAGFTYGSEYDTQAKIEAVKYDTPGGTHATHVVGIAAGGYRDSGFYGVATGADIVFVSFSQRSTSVSDALSYIYKYADEVKKPVVINMSLGDFMGPRDGNSTFDKIADALQGSGRLLVGSAGNDGDSFKHISKTFTVQPDTLRSFVTGNYKLANTDYVEIYGEVGFPVSVKLSVYNTETGRQVSESPLLSTSRVSSYTYSMASGINGSIDMYTEIEPSSKRPHILLVKNLTGVTSGYAVAVKLVSQEGKTVHAWDYSENFTDCGLSGWTTGDNHSTMMETGGTGKRIITAGSYVTKLFNPVTLNDISPMSSRGPTLDGRRKPDVTAPGDVLVSSYSDSPNIINSGFYKPLIDAGKTITVNGVNYYYGVMAGTSMASPMVAGTVAAWLQARPSLTPEEVRQIIQKTSRTDEFTGDTDITGNTWGWGKLDAWNGMKEVLQLNGVEDIESGGVDDILFYYSLSSGNIKLLFSRDCSEVQLSVYDASGHMVVVKRYNNVVTGDEITEPLDGLQKGIYIVNLRTAGFVKSLKIIR